MSIPNLTMKQVIHAIQCRTCFRLWMHDYWVWFYKKGTTMFEAIHRWFEHVIGNDTVTVKEGESLWKIAEDVTGNGSRWEELADANPDKHWNRNYVVQVGEQLKLPESWL